MTQSDRALRFKQLHIKGDPLIIYNVWDVGSALAVRDAGAKALATGSWSVAAAQGFPDGELLPLQRHFDLAAAITERIDLPLSIDLESGYAAEPEDLVANIHGLIRSGAIGLNFEDQIIGGTGVYPLEKQIARIKAVRKAAELEQMPLFINARTDLFLQEPDQSKHPALLDKVIERGLAFAEAGADGFFVPGLSNLQLITAICAAVPLPVNVFKRPDSPDLAALKKAGIARLSYGPGPYRLAMQYVTEQAKLALAGG